MSLSPYIPANSPLIILRPDPAEHVIMPVVCMGGDLRRCFARHNSLLGLVNGTFFEASRTVPNLYGDILTERRYVTGFEIDSRYILTRNDREYYFRPATHVVKPGYKLRWRVGIGPHGVEVAPGQPSTAADLGETHWVMGGAALLLHNGASPGFPPAAGDPLGLTSVEGGEFQRDVLKAVDRTLVLIDARGGLHLAVAKRCTPNTAAQAAVKEGYVTVLMLDGGGSTLLAHRTGPDSPPIPSVDTKREVQSYLGIHRLTPSRRMMPVYFDPLYQVAPAAALQAPTSWPALVPGDAGDEVQALHFLLAESTRHLVPGSTFTNDTTRVLNQHQLSKGLPVQAQVGQAEWPTLTRNLRLRDGGDIVKALQYLLKHRHSLYLGKFGAGGSGIDGDLGELSMDSVGFLQKRTGDVPRTTVDQATWMTALGPTTLARFDRQDLALKILATPEIDLWDRHSQSPLDAAVAVQNIRDTAAGQPARRTIGGTTPLDERMLAAVLRFYYDFGYTLEISEFAGGRHSRTSLHYSGLAVDIVRINGEWIRRHDRWTAPLREVADKLLALENLGPGDPDHATHVHFGWK